MPKYVYNYNNLIQFGKIQQFDFATISYFSVPGSSNLALVSFLEIPFWLNPLTQHITS